MSLPMIASPAEHDEARRELLAAEKALTRERDALNARRRELPMVEITKGYRFEGPQGQVGLADLFEGRPQLVIYHFMFHPEWEEGCASCTAGVDEIAPGFLEHLHRRGTTYALVSRAPLAKLERWKASRGWTVPWYSSGDGDFTYDFEVTLDQARGRDRYNYRSGDELPPGFFDAPQPFDMPGRSCFLHADGRVFHTYSQYARGLESSGGSYSVLDLTALGRQEDWEEPKGRAAEVRRAQPDFAS